LNAPARQIGGRVQTNSKFKKYKHEKSIQSHSGRRRSHRYFIHGLRRISWWSHAVRLHVGGNEFRRANQ